MPQVTIKSIKREDLISKSGKPWKSCNITVFSQTKNADVKLSGFGSSITDTWEVGDTVEVDIIDKENGYFDWRENANTKPSPDKKLEILKRIEMKLDILLGKKDAQEVAKEFNGQVVPLTVRPTLEHNTTTKEGQDNPTEIKVEDIPF